MMAGYGSLYFVYYLVHSSAGSWSDHFENYGYSCCCSVFDIVAVVVAVVVAAVVVVVVVEVSAAGGLAVAGVGYVVALSYRKGTEPCHDLSY